VGYTKKKKMDMIRNACFKMHLNKRGCLWGKNGVPAERAEFEMQGCPLQACLVLKRNVQKVVLDVVGPWSLFACVLTLCVIGTFWTFLLGVG
jgi:hypothetical protein